MSDSELHSSEGGRLGGSCKMRQGLLDDCMSEFIVKLCKLYVDKLNHPVGLFLSLFQG
jgi:hypothetical protein